MRKFGSILAALLFLTLVSCEGQYVPQGPFWREIAVDMGNYHNMNDIAPLSVDNVWLVGCDGVIYHYTGGESLDMYKPNKFAINAVDMLDNAEGFACGEMGTLLHYTYTENYWAIMPSPYLGNLYDILMLSGDNVWAVGQDGSILHYDGEEWKFSDSGTTEDLLCIDGISANDIWAAGTGGIILHWDGTGWRELEPGVHHTGLTINDLKQVSSGRFYICGVLGLLAEYDNGTWTDIPTGLDNELNALDINGDLGFVVGAEGKILSLNGETAQLCYVVSNDAQLNSVVVRTTNEAWACGISGNFLRYR
jgi:photosystem II stability/assembly factor-like uncharacterized protein